MAGLYFHIPFCKRICAYCDFYKSVRLEQMDGVTAAMHRELDERQDYLRGEAVTRSCSTAPAPRKPPSRPTPTT